jgi:hypothetical protein
MPNEIFGFSKFLKYCNLKYGVDFDELWEIIVTYDNSKDNNEFLTNLMEKNLIDN